ncbi:MAG TPA: Rieske 2Fe-2S domain-containing protein [Ktedonobacteraceae bacterium]|jgi:Rieske Fe-S protein
MSEQRFLTPPYESYTGTTLGNYVLETLAEQSACGPVFQARHSQAGTTHRLRFLALPAPLCSEQRLVCLGHFQRAAGQVALLRHPALLPLHDYGIYRGVPYLVAPELPGAARSLQTWLTDEGPADLAYVGVLLAGLADVLEYVHQQGMLHLNLSARTIFLQADGQPLVRETGLLRMLSVRMGAPAGTLLALENGSPLLVDRQGGPLYALSLASAPAPELLLGQVPGTGTDVYALGALLYQLLTGHRALRAESLPALAHQHLHAPLPALSIWRQGLPGALDHLIGQAMSRDPARRLRTPGALAKAYAAIVSPAPGAYRSTARVQPDPPVRRAPVSRRRALALLAAGGVAAAGAATWALESNRPPGVAAPGGNAASSSDRVLARTRDIAPNSARAFPLPGSANPGVLIHLESGQFVAFHSTCTHAGCAVRYNGQDHLLACPCHGALFDPARRGQVVRGPASSPLTPVPITVQADGTITRNP